jgi:hypothetical protein
MAIVLAVIAAIGALTSWIAGAIFYVRTLATLPHERAPASLRWLVVIAWPFAVARLQGAAADHAARVNKALVAFIACLLVAAAAVAAATNLQRFAS